MVVLEQYTPVYLTIKVRKSENLRQWFDEQFTETYVRDHNVLTAKSWQIKVLNNRNGGDCVLVRVRVKFVNEEDLMLFKLRWM